MVRFGWIFSPAYRGLLRLCLPGAEKRWGRYLRADGYRGGPGGNEEEEETLVMLRWSERTSWVERGSVADWTPEVVADWQSRCDEAFGSLWDHAEEMDLVNAGAMWRQHEWEREEILSISYKPERAGLLVASERERQSSLSV